MQKRSLYSPTQVAVGSFVGGPMAAVYFLWENYVALENRSGARATLIWGTVFVVALLAILPFLPDKFPNLVIPIVYMVIARQIAEKGQMSKQQIQASENYTFQSGWRVFGLSVLLLAIFAAVTVGWLLGLDAAGVIRL